MREEKKQGAARTMRCSYDKMKEYLPFAVVALAAVIWHVTLTVSVGDDMFHTQIGVKTAQWRAAARQEIYGVLF